MPIRILPPGVAAGIAAGEIIERPASVVKELIENSLDADATVVSVEIQQGGLQSIRVTDNGAGIPEDELLLAFERHATSKLISLEGLSQITTLGFRGEALASIAAAAHVRMTTRTASAQAASVVEAHEAGIKLQKRQATAHGSTVMVEALFSTIPARLKFMRSSGAESARIRQVIEHMAMANPSVRFTLKSEQRVIIQTSGNGDVRDVLGHVFGSIAASEMLEVTASPRAQFSVLGMIGQPSQNRPNRTGISLFVNGRWVQSLTLSTAVREAYRGLLMEGRYPMAALFITVPPEVVDVNVHPNKREVRFTNDGDIFSSVERSIREVLIRAHPQVQARGLFVTAAEDSRSMPAAARAFDFTVSATSNPTEPLPEPNQTSGDTSLVKLGPDGAPETLLHQPVWDTNELRVLGQIAKTYIVAEGQEAMHLIDQHSAHESVLYYRLLRQWENMLPDVQPMLDPLPIQLTPEQMETMVLAQDTLARYGLALEAFGDSNYLLRSVPSMARRIDGARLVQDVLDVVRGAGISRAGAHQVIAASLACHSAVRAGQALDQQEMEALSKALITESNPQHCPHGRPTIIQVTTHMLEREFGRV